MKRYCRSLIACAVLALAAVGCEAQAPGAVESAAPELFQSLAEQAQDTRAAVGELSRSAVKSGDITALQEAINGLPQKVQNSVDGAVLALKSAIDAAVQPPLPVARQSPMQAEPPPTLILFTADWCLNCPFHKTKAAELQSQGVNVRVVAVDVDGAVPGVDLQAEVNMLPTWVRLDGAGKEIDRVPAVGADRFTEIELQRVLTGRQGPPPAAPQRPVPIAQTPRQQVLAPMSRPSRRAARRGI